MIFSNTVIPSIYTMKEFEVFLESDFEYCVLLDFHVSLLDGMMKELHQRGKKGIVHLDLVRGLKNDEFGTEYLCQKIHVDGVISTKTKVIEYAKKNHKIAILRIFLIDSKSLEKGLDMANAIMPDYIEILPGIAYDVLPYIRFKTSVPLIGGGLIKSIEQIKRGLNSGLSAVTIGSLSLCLKYLESKSDTIK